MKELIIKVITKKEIDFPMSLDEMRQFPTHECRQILFEEKLVTVAYKPVKGFNQVGFERLVTNRFKKILNAHSVEVVERANKEIG